MKKLIFILAASLLAATPLRAGGTLTDSVASGIASTESAISPTLGTNPDAPQLSLQKCLEIALNDNPSIRVADMEVERVNYASKETRGGLFPTIDFQGAYQRTIKLQTIQMNMGGQNTEFKMGSDNTWNFGFNASMPLIAPQLWKSIQISDTQILANLESARASRLDLVNNVKKAYFSLLLAIASRDVVLQNYDIAKLNASLYEKRFEAGTATEYDVLRSSVQVKTLEPELLQANIAIRQCKLQLKVLMGIADTFDFEPDISLKDMQQEMYAYNLNRDKNILNDNTSLRTLDIQSRMLEQTVDLRKFAWIPTLGASFNINWNALSNGNAFKNQTFHPYSNVGLAVNIPIFSGGTKYNSLKQAEVQLKELSFQRENLINSLSMQVDLAIENINMEAKQIETSAQSVKQAEKAHQIMQKSFEIGAATFLDLRDSELAQTGAKLAYYQAIYNYLVSSSDLDLLLGRDDILNKN